MVALKGSLEIGDKINQIIGRLAEPSGIVRCLMNKNGCIISWG